MTYLAWFLAIMFGIGVGASLVMHLRNEVDERRERLAAPGPAPIPRAFFSWDDPELREWEQGHIDEWEREFQ